MYRHAVAQGLQPRFAPRDAEWGEHYFHITDPDGHYQSGLLRFSVNPENMMLKLMLILASSPALASTECCR